MKLFDKLLKRDNTESRNINKAQERIALWQSVGVLDTDVLAFLINPAFQNLPCWPDLRQAYRRLRTDHSIILTTDGLSDEFTDSKSANNGFDIELYVEIPDNEFPSIELEDIKKTWVFSMLYQTASNAAHKGVFKDYHLKYGVFSLELYDVVMPEQFQYANQIGVLIGLESDTMPTKVILGGKEMYNLCITVLTSEELQYIHEHGSQGREEIVSKLILNGNKNISSTNRKSVI